MSFASWRTTRKFTLVPLSTSFRRAARLTSHPLGGSEPQMVTRVPLSTDSWK